MTPLDQRLDAPAYGEAPRPLETLVFTVEAICNGKGAPRLCRRTRPPTRHRGEAAPAARARSRSRSPETSGRERRSRRECRRRPHRPRRSPRTGARAGLTATATTGRARPVFYLGVAGARGGARPAG